MISKLYKETEGVLEGNLVLIDWNWEMASLEWPDSAKIFTNAIRELWDVSRRGCSWEIREIVEFGENRKLDNG